MTTALFQKTMTDLDLAMFCFPKSQPSDPYNCALVSLQFMRLITPVKSNALIPRYPRGVPFEEILTFLKTNYNLDLQLFELMPGQIFDGYLGNYVLPGFASLLLLVSETKPLSHSVVYFKTSRSLEFLIDPQTGKIYSNSIETPLIKKLETFLKRHEINKIFVFRYKEAFPYEIHRIISTKIDEILGTQSIETFFKRGEIIETGTFPSSEVEMTAGKKSMRTRKRLPRATKLTR